MGAFCKHQVAVFYALRENRGQDSTTSDTPATLQPSSKQDKSQTKKSPSERYASIIAAQPKERLVDFLVSLCLEYDEIWSRASFKFGGGSIANEVYAIWVQHILNAAQKANDRRDYQVICSHIRSLIKDGGTTQARQVASQLLSTYTRKPAFKEELGKVSRLG